MIDSLLELHFKLGEWTNMHGWLDWLILAAYALALLVIGGRAGWGKQSSEDITLGGRSIPVWAVLLSLLATELSAATFIAVPSKSFTGSWTYLQFSVGFLLGKILLVYTLLPLYHKHGVVTVYGFIEERLGAGARWLTAFFFVIGRIIASSIRLYIAAFAAAEVFDIELERSVLFCAVLVGLYTLSGGIRSVIWTDCVQAVVFIAAALGMLYFLQQNFSISQLLDWASSHEKLQMVQSASQSVDGESRLEHFLRVYVGQEWNWVNSIIFGAGLALASHGTDHDMVQRLLTTKTSGGSRFALFASGLISIPVVMIFLLVGTACAFYYELNGVAGSSDKVVMHIATSMPMGLFGLFLIGLFAAAMSSLDSATCAISTTLVHDLLPTDWRKKYEGILYRLASILIIAVLAGGALLAPDLREAGSSKDLVDFALSAMTLIYGALLGLFAYAFFSRRKISFVSALIGLCVGTAFGFLFYFQTKVLGYYFEYPAGHKAQVWIGAHLRIPICALITFKVICLVQLIMGKRAESEE